MEENWSKLSAGKFVPNAIAYDSLAIDPKKPMQCLNRMDKDFILGRIYNKAVTVHRAQDIFRARKFIVQNLVLESSTSVFRMNIVETEHYPSIFVELLAKRKNAIVAEIKRLSLEKH